MLATLRAVYSPKYVLLNAVAAAAYYAVAYELVRLQNYGIFLLLDVPAYLFYLLVASSSVLLTISVYAAFNTRRNRAEFTASSLGTATAVLAGVVSGCGCSAPLLLGLTALGLSAGGLFSASVFLTNTAVWLFAAMILINLGVITYYMNKLHSASCRLQPKKPKRR